MKNIDQYPNQGDSHTYSLVSSDGDSNNTSLVISDDNLSMVSMWVLLIPMFNDINTNHSIYVTFDLEIPEWKQPTGAHDCYNIGDKMSYNGECYESLINGNVWPPDVYAPGWKIISCN